MIPAAVLDVPAAVSAYNVPSTTGASSHMSAAAPPTAHVPPLQQCMCSTPPTAGVGLLPMAGNISNPAMHFAATQAVAQRQPGTSHVCGHLARLGHYGRLHTQRGRDLTTAQVSGSTLQGQLACPLPVSEWRRSGRGQTGDGSDCTSAPSGRGQKRKKWVGLCDCDICAADLKNRK